MPVAELRRTRIPSRPEIWSRIAPFFIVDYGEHVGRIYLSLISDCADRDMNGPQIVKALNQAILTFADVNRIRSPDFRLLASPSRINYRWDRLRNLIFALIDDRQVREDAFNAVYTVRRR